VRIHEGPVGVSFDTLHEQVGDPKAVEEITSAVLILASGTTEHQEVEDVVVPRLEVDSEGALALTSTLIDVASGVIPNTEHGNQTI
jgi:hypothetical protein